MPGMPDSLQQTKGARVKQEYPDQTLKSEEAVVKTVEEDMSIPIIIGVAILGLFAFIR